MSNTNSCFHKKKLKRKYKLNYIFVQKIEINIVKESKKEKNDENQNVRQEE